MVASISWMSSIYDAYGIEVLSKQELYKLVQHRNVLWVTRCSRTKRKKRGYPVEMYDSYINRYFYRFAMNNDLPFAIISDKYGLHYSDEKLPYYNTHPSSLTPEDKIVLGQEIRRKANVRRFRKIVFYNNSPLMSKPYLEMLSAAGVSSFFTTQLI